MENKADRTDRNNKPIWWAWDLVAPPAPPAVKHFFIPGHPEPKPRMTHKSKYQEEAQRYLRYKCMVAKSAHYEHGVRPLVGDIRLSMAFFLIPNRGKVPDLKNLLAGVEDALNGVAYHDDKQVCEYGRMQRIIVDERFEEGVEVRVESLEEKDDKQDK